MQASLTGSLLRTKKGMVLKGFPFLTACGDPQTCFCSRLLCTYRRNKKSAKRLPCLYMVSSGTTYNPKQRMPRPSSIQAVPEPAAYGKCGCSGYFHTGYTIVFPSFTDRHRIKINYEIILAQHLVFCQLNNTISSVFSSSFLYGKSISKICFTFFQIFSSICAPAMYFLFRLTCYSSPSVSCIRPPFFDNRRTYTLMYMGSGGLFTADNAVTRPD